MDGANKRTRGAQESDITTEVGDSALLQSALSRVARRLIPLIAVIYTFNILDRTNVSIAALTMKGDLGFSDRVYSTGAGIFFLGYFLFELPSNLILERVGARLWITRIMITWGVISAAMLFVRTPAQFYSLRFLLGLAEAGFYPGIILYLTYWFPTRERAKAVARFVAISGLVGVLGGPLSGQLMRLEGVFGLLGWQWLFLLEGLPSCVLGFVALRYLTDRPEQAHWLPDEEKRALIARLNIETSHRQAAHSLTLAQALKSRELIHFCALFFLYVTAGYGMSFFVPLIFKAQTNWSTQMISVVASLPGLFGAVAMLIGAAHSDKTCERKYHVAFGVAVASLGVVLTALSHNPFFTIAALILAEIGRGSIQGPFWAMPTSMLTGAAAAGGIALINSVGNLGGFVGPKIMGELKDATNSYQTGILILAGMLMGATVLAVFAPHDPARERAMREKAVVATDTSADA